MRDRVRDREGDPEDRVGPELGLVVGPVEVPHQRVEATLIEGVRAQQRGPDGVVDVRDGLADALAPEALVAVAQLEGLVGAGRCPRGHDRPAPAPGIEDDLGLDRGVAAGVEDLPGPHEARSHSSS